MSAATETFESGAVRGTDLAELRYDLIPGAWRARFFRSYNHISPVVDNVIQTTPSGGKPVGHLVILAETFLSDYLSGDAKGDWLIAAGICLFKAMLLQNDKADFRETPLTRLARVCANGAKKYGEHNWRKGFPISSLLNHAIRHTDIAQSRLADPSKPPTGEDDIAHAYWNVLVAIEMEEVHGLKFQDVKTREELPTPPWLQGKISLYTTSWGEFPSNVNVDAVVKARQQLNEVGPDSDAYKRAKNAGFASVYAGTDPEPVDTVR